MGTGVGRVHPIAHAANDADRLPPNLDNDADRADFDQTYLQPFVLEGSFRDGGAEFPPTLSARTSTLNLRVNLNRCLYREVRKPVP